MLAPRSAKALQEKVLLNVQGIRKLLGSPSLGGTLFWMIAELASLRKADEIIIIAGLGRGDNTVSCPLARPRVGATTSELPTMGSSSTD
ncbi:hypothetical protein Tco_0573472 [Tanacetum coccineum]